MTRSWLTDTKPELIGKLTVGAVVFIGLIATGTGGMALYKSGQARTADAKIKSLNAELHDVQGSLKHVDEVLASGPQIVGPSGKPIVVKFQSSIEKVARANHVNVEFTQVGDPALFLSRFKNEPDGTLQQIELRMTLSGSLSEVTRTLDQFSSFRIPFEFGETQIERDTSATGYGRVIARVAAYVLVPTQV